MKVTVKLFAYFRESRFKIEEWGIDEKASVGEVVDLLNINREEVGVLMINSKHTSFETTLSENDILAIFPVIGGG